MSTPPPARMGRAITPAPMARSSPVRMKKSATNVRAGISIDQAIAREVGHLTRLASLELTCDAGRNTGACDSGYSCAYQYNVSWFAHHTDDARGESAPSIRAAFRCGLGGRAHGGMKRRRAEQRSIWILCWKMRGHATSPEPDGQGQAGSIPHRRAGTGSTDSTGGKTG